MKHIHTKGRRLHHYLYVCTWNISIYYCIMLKAKTSPASNLRISPGELDKTGCQQPMYIIISGLNRLTYFLPSAELVGEEFSNGHHEIGSSKSL